MKGISFSPEMAEAILAGRKTQTRRIVKTEKPPFKVGETVYVREATQIVVVKGFMAVVHYETGEILKKELSPTSKAKIEKRKYPFRWLAPRYMLADFSRVSIRIKEVRREKLSDITEASAIAEGIDKVGYMYLDYLSGGYSFRSPISSFISLWRKIHPEQRGWDTEVWVIIFEL